MEKNSGLLHTRSLRHQNYLLPVLTFALGAVIATLVAVGISSRDIRAPAVREVVDFHFQMLNISSPRQNDKLLNIFVKWRYPSGTDRCPFNPTDNNCIQYQLIPMEYIRNVTQQAQPGLPLGAEWERVVLHLCRYLMDNYVIIAVSVLLQVNGDGRSWVQAYEPGAHGSTCTIGPPEFAPIEKWNPLPDFVDGDDGPGQPKTVQ
eukprot:CAMPEP_0174739972 /NCGR_PEP_ID=MMETSP1094-20130205/72493_1 /TAXON_ID=156173 /ORGANISM="Chrysochromulina brevifilum, Strain UTEX LB 985" /LENGTH=203 /DNA_ID=CAMNT_0015943599 /DNA_START=26 /DNA_END=637 /DNA_ORIENTATION=+